VCILSWIASVCQADSQGFCSRQNSLPACCGRSTRSVIILRAVAVGVRIPSVRVPCPRYLLLTGSVSLKCLMHDASRSTSKDMIDA